MRRLLGYFLRGLVFLAPVAVTVYVCVVAFTTIDGWLGIAIPGVGFLATIGLITLFGFLTSNLLTRGVLTLLDRSLERLPFVRLLYTATKDLVGAVVGDKRKFDKPVLVQMHENDTGLTLGFMTHESAERLGLEGYVSVYLPFSYSVAGRVYLFPSHVVFPVDASSADVMAFIVAGGVPAIPEVGSPPSLPPGFPVRAASRASDE
ncbi:MAG: hypothetical protein MNPFHGCM_03203 [Gemmatimonadaceae bacterium]|nr:hypothetical protein [Gemmatimonadaceae bacterium]